MEISPEAATDCINQTHYSRQHTYYHAYQDVTKKTEKISVTFVYSLLYTCISQAQWVKIQKYESNEINNFVYSTDRLLVNILVKSTCCWNLLFCLVQKWSKSATKFATGLKYLKIRLNRLFYNDFHRKTTFAFLHLRFFPWSRFETFCSLYKRQRKR